MNIKRSFDIPDLQLEKHPLEDALVKMQDGHLEKYSTQKYVDLSKKVSKSLYALGIRKNDKIAISSDNRPEWNIVDAGIARLGAWSIPIYPTVSADTATHIIKHSETKICFIDKPEIADKIESIKSKTPTLEQVVAFDSCKACTDFADFLKIGESISDEEIERMSAEVSEDDIFTIIYTSGTTGIPKGVVLTHKNVVSNVINSKHHIDLKPDFITLSFLPLSHIFERMVGLAYQHNFCRTYYAESNDTIAKNAQEIKPDVMTVVPRLLEKVFDKIMDKGNTLKGIKRSLFFWAVGLGLKHEPLSKPSLSLKIARKLIFSKWQAALGGNIKYLISGSAPLQHRLIRIFWAADIPVLEGYGLTETSPVVSVNQTHLDGFKIGSVGKPIPGVEIRMEADGEILIKGDNIMQGYYKEDKLNEEVFTEDGFLRTGDIGTFENGFLKITDRKKELMKTSGGKFIAPQPIENDLKKSRFIEQIMLVAEGWKFPSALIIPDRGYLKSWCDNEGLSFANEDEMLKSQAIHDAIMKEVGEVNQNLGKWEQVKKIKVLTDIWAIETGELTPTLKIKRKVILEKHKKEIEEIYAS